MNISDASVLQQRVYSDGIDDGNGHRIGQLKIGFQHIIQTLICPDQRIIGFTKVEILFDLAIPGIYLAGNTVGHVSKCRVVVVAVTDNKIDAQYLQYQEQQEVEIATDE